MKKKKKVIMSVSIVLPAVLLISLILFFIIGGTMANKREDLLKALYTRDLVKAEELLKQGVNPNKRTTSIYLPYTFALLDIVSEYPMLAISRNSGSVSGSEALKLVVKYGGDVNLRSDGETPLIAMCSSSGSYTLKNIEFIIGKGADVNLSSKNGKYPILEAIGRPTEKEYRQEIFFYLLEHGARIDVIGGSLKASVLHWASVYNYKDIVEYLLAQGFDTSLKTSDGKTALDYAIEEGHQEIIDLLT